MTTERWLVTGAGGMLGWEFKQLIPQARLLSHQDLDVESRHDLSAAIKDANLVINLAAYTKVDDAETNELQARRVNTWGAGRVAGLCAQHKRPLIHLSTDYVFTGDTNVPYDEHALTGPPQLLNAYGRTKLEGERLVLAQPNSYVVRTAWLYGSGGPNFVKSILRLSHSQDELTVVDDQTGQPTWARALAKQLVTFAGRTLSGDKPRPGVYHATASGHTTWYGFARAIFAHTGLDPERIKPMTTEQLNRPAKRPKFSVLGHDRWRLANMDPMQSWEEMLKEALDADPGLHS